MQPEFVSDGKRNYCMIIRRNLSAAVTTFFSADPDLLQVGLVCRDAGDPIPRHFHVKNERRIGHTWEFLLVRKGSMTLTLFDDDKHPFAERLLEEGDAVLLMAGGHGFLPHDDLVLLEVKQGPFTEGKDKERF